MPDVWFSGWRWLLDCTLVVCVFSGTAGPASGSELSPQVGRSLVLLAKSAQSYTEQRTCFSCHHQTLPVLALQQARGRGFKVSAEAIPRQLAFTQRFFAGRRALVAMGKDVPGGPFTAGYALLALGENCWPCDHTTDALVHNLIRHQPADGSWWIVPHRHPMKQSVFTATALLLRGLQLYALTDKATLSMRKEVQARIDCAAQWLDATPARTHEDKVFRSWGLIGSGIAAARRSELGTLLWKVQRADGGWAQVNDLDSDAYATGQALVVLHQANKVDPRSAAYRKGVAHLLQQQQEDGSWLVKTRCEPVQDYF